jgi:hypothetical protein
MRPHHLTILLSLLLIPCLNSAQATDTTFNLDYSTLTVLPSATGQNLQFVSGSYLGITESQAFQVGTGFLSLTTPSGYSLTRGGIYNLANGYDSSLDLDYRFTAKVTNGTLDALQFAFGDATYYGRLGIGPTGYAFPGAGNNTDLGVDPKQYHDYRITSAANSGTFSLWIDGTQAYTGNLASSGGGSSYVYFGQPYNYSSSGYVTAEIKSISYSNQMTVVPEASTLLPLLVSGLLVCRRKLWQKSRR